MSQIVDQPTLDFWITKFKIIQELSKQEISQITKIPGTLRPFVEHNL